MGITTYFGNFLVLSMLGGLLWVAPVSGATQDSAGISMPADSPSMLIDSIEIVTENVFDLSDPRYNNLVFRLANHTHIVTRKAKIRRELVLHKGASYDTSLVAESIRNLRRLEYLYKSDIRMKTGNRGENILVVTTSDKWTVSGGVSPGRSGGWNRLEISLSDRNCSISRKRGRFIRRKSGMRGYGVPTWRERLDFRTIRDWGAC
jgi:hypothetical protein